MNIDRHVFRCIGTVSYIHACMHTYVDTFVSWRPWAPVSEEREDDHHHRLGASECRHRDLQVGLLQRASRHESGRGASCEGRPFGLGFGDEELGSGLLENERRHATPRHRGWYPSQLSIVNSVNKTQVRELHQDLRRIPCERQQPRHEPEDAPSPTETLARDPFRDHASRSWPEAALPTWSVGAAGAAKA